MEHLPTIIYHTIPGQTQRYITAGDYFKEYGSWHFKVSRMGDPRYELLCFVHELVEWFLTQQFGISESLITKFDMNHPELDDPGTDPRAPYHKQHMISTKIEKLLAKLLGVNWKKYYDQFNDLPYPKA